MTSTRRQNADTKGRIAARSQPMFNRVLPAHPVAVRDTLGDIRRRFAAEVGEDTLARLELVLAEVMNNVTEHGAGISVEDDPGRAPSIHISIVRHVSGLCCAITDDGASLPDECLQPRSLPSLTQPDLPEGGWGWYMIQDLTQALCYFREDQRNYLAFSVPFSEEARPQ